MRIDFRAERAEQVARHMQRIAENTKRQMGEAAYEATQLVKGATEERVIIPRQVSRQDAPKFMRLTRRSPVRARVARGEAKGFVELVSHWTSARTPGIIRFVRQYGQPSDLVRKQLHVVTAPGGKKANPEAEPMRMAFRSWPRLEKWGQREDRGRQVNRHAIRLKNPNIRLKLILDPAVREQREAVIEVFRSHAVRGLLS